MAGSSALVAEQKPWKGSEEKPLLLDPGFDDPEQHITFVFLGGKKGFVPRPKNGSPQGKATIELAQLDRDELQRLRKEQLEELQEIVRDFNRAQKDGDGEGMERARSRAKRRSSPEARFSLMAKVVFRHFGLL